MMNISYREAVKALTRASTMTKKDMANAVRFVTRYYGNPRKAHWKAVVQILEYPLRGYERRNHIHRKQSNWGYDHADYVQNLDARRSVSGEVIMPASSPLFFFLGGCSE